MSYIKNMENLEVLVTVITIYYLIIRHSKLPSNMIGNVNK